MKLKFSEVVELIKYGIAAMGASYLFFVVPYALVKFGYIATNEVGGKNSAKLICYGVSAIVLWIILSHISAILLDIGKFFIELGNMTQKMSHLKRTLFSILGFLYFVCCSYYFEITLIVTTTILIPAETMYIRYKTILKAKV